MCKTDKTVEEYLKELSSEIATWDEESFDDRLPVSPPSNDLEQWYRKQHPEVHH